MSVNLPQLFARQYATNVALLLQQKGSILRKAVTEGSYKGEQASPVDQVGAVEMSEVTTRFAPMPRTDAAVDRRWVLPTSFDLNQLEDSFDKLKLVSDPKGKYVENAVMAAGRKIDAVLLAQMYANNQTGKDGTTGTPFLSANEVAVTEGSTGNSGLTVAKLRAARKLFMASNINLGEEELYIAVTSQQHDNLLAEAQVISGDYNSKLVLVDGMINRFLGFNFLHTELVPFSTYRQVPFWVKSGMHLGMWSDIITDIGERKDIQGVPWQAYVKMTIGGTRIEEKKVGRILCAE